MQHSHNADESEHFDSDAFLSVVRDLRGLPIIEQGVVRGIDFSNSDLTDAQLAALPAVSSIEYLDLEKTLVTDAGLLRLSRFTALSELYLSYTGVSGTGLPGEVASRLTNLRMCRCPRVTDSSISFVAGCQSLVKLHLDENGIGDGAMTHVSAVQSLQKLTLYGTGVTDLGMLQLRALRKLKMLDVRYTQVTSRGCAALREVFPSLIFAIEEHPRRGAEKGTT